MDHWFQGFENISNYGWTMRASFFSEEKSINTALRRAKCILCQKCVSSSDLICICSITWKLWFFNGMARTRKLNHNRLLFFGVRGNWLLLPQEKSSKIPPPGISMMENQARLLSLLFINRGSHFPLTRL